MAANKIVNEYDQIKGLLNKVRKIQAIGSANKQEHLLQEQMIGDEKSQVGQESSGKEDIYRNLKYDKNQEDVQDPTIKNIPGNEEQEDLAVINNVEIKIHSEDPEDLGLQDEEKTKISQLIDDFRSEVSEIAEFSNLHIYDDSAKLEGVLTDMNLNFMFSTGDDTGLYISNTSLLKIDDGVLNMINKLKGFEAKFSNTINDLLLNRSTT